MPETLAAIFKGVPWARLTVHMIPVILVVYYVGNWLLKIYTLNLEHNIVGAFPTTYIFCIYFFSAIGILTINVLLDIWDVFNTTTKKVKRAKKPMGTTPTELTP